MPATTPEQVNELLIEALTNGDLDAALAMYEPGASFVSNGETVSGIDAIRPLLESFIAVKPRFSLTAKPTARSGDLALTGNHWSLAGTDGDGNEIAMSGSSFEVVRQGTDGYWRFVIDNPDIGE